MCPHLSGHGACPKCASERVLEWRTGTPPAKIEEPKDEGREPKPAEPLPGQASLFEEERT